MNERIGSSLSGGETDSKNRRGNRTEEGREGAIEGTTKSRIWALLTFTGRCDSVLCAPAVLCCAAYVGNVDSSVTHVLFSFPTRPITLCFIY